MFKFIDRIKVAILHQLSNFRIYPWPLFLIYNPHTFTVKGHHYYEARKLLQPGDMLLRGYKQYLSGYLIPGKYSHVGIYIGGDEEQIVHAFPDTVQYANLAHFMRCDTFAIVRPNVSKKDIKLALDRAISKVGTAYDFNFIFEETDFTARQFSCSELCYFAYQKNLNKLKWVIEETKYLFFRKSLFTPDACLPSEGSSSKTIYEI